VEAESSQHFSPPKTGHAQRPAIEILDHPPLFQRDFQEGGTEGATDMGPSFAPIEACTRKPAAQRTSCVNVDA